MKKTEKSVFIDNLTSELKTTKSVILVNYSGLSVANQIELKKRLKETGARFVVIKNTLLKLAGKNAKVTDEILTDTVLVGQNALVLADEDPIKPISILAKFAKEFEKPQIKVGIIEGSFASNESLTNLASLGSKNAVVGQLVGILSAPTYQIVSTLEAKLQELIYVLGSIKPGNTGDKSPTA